ncbi:alcohol dehydrogenase catalytic domain-containing protein [Streptomyces sp. NRRL WC-3618]|uniref:alcohol dehydrogenase catalytic domain-containing protein n=1 Tax=Streptomyces sp. NRRL WC-3618 TaxID=1519490 RepID=UPI002D21DF61|nr:alcohol dehydrogenase catalytic domain-containing protein [Streptomyces sp. NRRL WC-3618]
MTRATGPRPEAGPSTTPPCGAAPTGPGCELPPAPLRGPPPVIVGRVPPAWPGDLDLSVHFWRPNVLPVPPRRAAQEGVTHAAIRIEEHGGPEVMRWTELPDPAPVPGEALVRLGMAGVNYMDVGARAEGSPGWAAPVVLGAEGMGYVTALGEGVRDVAVGDRVRHYRPAHPDELVAGHRRGPGPRRGTRAGGTGTRGRRRRRRLTRPPEPAVTSSSPTSRASSWPTPTRPRAPASVSPCSRTSPARCATSPRSRPPPTVPAVMCCPRPCPAHPAPPSAAPCA